MINSIQPKTNYNSTSLNKNTKSPAFGKSYATFVGDTLHLPQMYEKLSKAKPVQKIVNSLSKNPNACLHMMVADSALISGTYMVRTLKNKKIDKKQKPAMLINDALVFGFSASCTYLIDNKLNKLTDKFITKFAQVNKQNNDVLNNLDSYVQGIKKLKSVIIVGMIYRYVGPVIITPIANKLSKKFFDYRNNKTTQNPTEVKDNQSNTQKS